MPPLCKRCVSQRVINLKTARTLGIAAGALAGSLKGASVSLCSSGNADLATSTPFPLGRVATAIVAGASGGIAGAAAGHRLIWHLVPSGNGVPWLCVSCGHPFRVSD